MCKKITAHLEEREHWLPPECRNGWALPAKKEIWDGKRFAELSYFWDPTKEWVLPTYCPIEGCHKVLWSCCMLQKLVVSEHAWKFSPQIRPQKCPQFPVPN